MCDGAARFDEREVHGVHRGDSNDTDWDGICCTARAMNGPEDQMFGMWQT